MSHKGPITSLFARTREYGLNQYLYMGAARFARDFSLLKTFSKPLASLAGSAFWLCGERASLWAGYAASPATGLRPIYGSTLKRSFLSFSYTQSRPEFAYCKRGSSRSFLARFEPRRCSR